MKYVLSIIALLSVSFSLLAQPILPASPIRNKVNVSLAWDASPTTNVTHYHLRRGDSSGNWTDMMRIDGRLNLTATWTNAPLGITNYFVVTAVVTSGLESDPSNELSVFYTRPVSPALKTAVPIVVTIMGTDGTNGLRARLTIGPYYVLTDSTNEMFVAKMKIGEPVQILP